MDDQLLEQRLDSLRKAYNDMHEEENRSEILAAIKKDQKRNSQNKWFHLPYAASFIGVGMIAGILMMQYIDENGASTEKPGIHKPSADNTQKAGNLTESEVKGKIHSLQVYYSERQTETKEKLGFGAGFEELFYQNILDSIDQLESEMLENPEAYDRGEFEQITEQKKREITEAFTMPSEIIEKLSRGVGNHRYGSGDEYNLLVQLESYWGAYLQSLVLYEWEIDKALEQESAAEVVEKLNAGGEGISTPGLKRLAEGLVRNGYAFRQVDGKIEIYINYMAIAQKLKPEGDPDFIYYLELKSNRVQDLQGNVISYRDLGHLLVKLEKGIAVVRDSAIEQWMRNDAQSLYGLFVMGNPAKPLFDENNVLKKEVKNAYQYLVETYPNTDTGTSIQIFYEQLEKNNFKQSPDFSMRAIIYPRYMNIPGPRDLEQNFTQSIYPLTNDLLSSYKEFAAKKDFNILKYYGPFEIMQLYFHADQQKDYATKYALYSKNEAMPNEEQYIKEQREAGIDLSQVLKGFDFASLYHSEDDPEKVTGVQLYFKDRSGSQVFQMVQEDGVWKVKYMPLQ